MSALTTYLQVVAHIRARGPRTSFEVAADLGWPITQARNAVDRAENNMLLRKVGKVGNRFVYAAVQTIKWPPRVQA